VLANTYLISYSTKSFAVKAYLVFYIPSQA
jgi:hypothetical protein